MARLSLSKTQLAKENTNLAMYRRYLPSLDLKRRQLTAERNKTQARIAEIEAQIERRVERIGEEIPMLANQDIDLKGFATLKTVTIGERNVVGLRLPSLEEIEVDVARYGYLVRPHWVDLVAERLKEVLRLKVEAQVTQRQVALLDAAVTKVTQRVNLFDRVLIPHTRANIRRIDIALGDRERSAVVNAKIAKHKTQST
ncbi:MAG: V-type ATP synthase subunit D [Steroidobacteraceae bacterium]